MTSSPDVKEGWGRCSEERQKKKKKEDTMASVLFCNVMWCKQVGRGSVKAQSAATTSPDFHSYRNTKDTHTLWSLTH